MDGLRYDLQRPLFGCCITSVVAAARREPNFTSQSSHRARGWPGYPLARSTLVAFFLPSRRGTGRRSPIPGSRRVGISGRKLLLNLLVAAVGGNDAQQRQRASSEAHPGSSKRLVQRKLSGNSKSSPRAHTNSPSPATGSAASNRPTTRFHHPANQRPRRTTGTTASPRGRSTILSPERAARQRHIG